MATSELIGPSPRFRALLTEVEKVAPVHSAILMQGEKGAGKEVFARAIHGASPRVSRRFMALNCSANQSALLESGLLYAAAADVDDRKVAQQRLQQEDVPQREGVDKAPTFEEIVGALRT